MRQTLVTAVIPVYAREDVFGTLEALAGFRHEGVDLWAFVVDNGNGESLSERLAELPRYHGWCTIVRRGVGGEVRAVGVVLRRAQSALVLASIQAFRGGGRAAETGVAADVSADAWRGRGRELACAGG